MDKRIIYVEWRYAFEDSINRKIFSETSWPTVLAMILYDTQQLIYIYFEDITDIPIEDFERKVANLNAM